MPLFIICFLLFESCKHAPHTSNYIDNIAPINSSLIGHIHNIVIIGNSITTHPPKPELGWNGNWGMAASSPDSDYVHILIRRIAAKDNTVKVHYGIFAKFEQEFWKYSLSEFDSLRQLHPELIIMRIAENVRDSAIAQYDFISKYDSLIHYLDPDHNAQVLITNGVWVDKPVSDLIYNYAASHNLPFISFTQMDADSSMMAYGQFNDFGVAHHPGNKGMRYIADKLWLYIQKYY